mmetsp:Transcript_11665/g.37285  ORF Transcript_11665/g.37285 Transcript_11665/m.37285 type:complete len:279 (+) Transcript_11665:862-1698(+)
MAAPGGGLRRHRAQTSCPWPSLLDPTELAASAAPQVTQPGPALCRCTTPATRAARAGTPAGRGASQAAQHASELKLLRVHRGQAHWPGGTTTGAGAGAGARSASGELASAANRASAMPSSAVKSARPMLSASPQKRPHTAPTAARSSSRSSSPVPKVLMRARVSVSRVSTSASAAQKSNQPPTSSTSRGGSASRARRVQLPEAILTRRSNSSALATPSWPAACCQGPSTRSSTARMSNHSKAFSKSLAAWASRMPPAGSANTENILAPSLCGRAETSR